MQGIFGLLVVASLSNVVMNDDEIAYFTVRWKTRASFVYRSAEPETADITPECVLSLQMSTM